MQPSRHPSPCQRALCLLIQDHLTDVGLIGHGTTEFGDEGTAYEAWMKLTNSQVGVIALDTCEELAEKDGFSVHSDRTRYTMLEEFCVSIPAPHAIVCVGCSASINRTEFVLTKANVTTLEPLEPIAQREVAAALDSWSVKADEALRLLFHELTGGVPPVLRDASVRSYTGFLLQQPGRSYTSAFDSWALYVQEALYPLLKPPQ